VLGSPMTDDPNLNLMDGAGLSVRFDRLCLDVPEDWWDEDGPEELPWARLSLRKGLNLAGLDLHVEAFAVRENLETEEQEGVHEWCEEVCTAIWSFYPGGAFYTTEIRGHEYIIVCHPYQH